MSNKARTGIGIGIAVVVVIVLASCMAGTSPSTSSSAPATSPTPIVSTAHNTADMEFATMMPVHHQGAMDMSGMTMPSTNPSAMEMPGMTTKDMADLKAAKGKAFDKLFLQLMIVHHQAGIDMAKTELVKGRNPQALSLAASIVSSQTAEITRMQTMLKTLG